MILSDKDIRFAMQSGGLVIRPAPEIIQPASVDLHLGSTRVELWHGRYIVGSPYPILKQELPETFTEHWLFPGDFVNVSVAEWIEIPPGLVGILVGKSSGARVALQVESAGYIDPGYKGKPTLELKNLGPKTLILTPGIDICQIRFEAMSSHPSRLYGDPELGSHYQGALYAQAARFTTPEETIDDARKDR